MTKIIITGAAIIFFEIVLATLREKLFKSIEQTPHKNMLSKMYLPKNIFKPFKKREWTPIKYVFKRKHKELKNKSLSNLSDFILVMYLVSWSLTIFFTLQLSVIYT